MGLQDRLVRLFRLESILKNESSINLFEKTGLTKPVLLEKIEKEILQASPTNQGLNSCFIKVGGSNNLGFLSHKGDSDQEELVSKLAYSQLIHREKLFLDWHSKHVEKKNAFAVAFIVSGVIDEVNQVEFITTKKLKPVNKPSNEKVLKLYKNAAKGTQFFVDNQSQFPSLEGGSRIRNCLLQLVTQPNAEKAETYINHFFSERTALMPEYKEQLNSCHQQLSKLIIEIYSVIEEMDIGFVHGDFKASNMLQESDESIRLIDFQYYCLGYREWDLAFYFSKKKNGFADIQHLFQEDLFDINQKKRLLFFYIVASLLHPKPERFIQIYKSQITTAISAYGNL